MKSSVSNPTTLHPWVRGRLRQSLFTTFWFQRFAVSGLPPSDYKHKTGQKSAIETEYNIILIIYQRHSHSTNARLFLLDPPDPNSADVAMNVQTM